MLKMIWHNIVTFGELVARNWYTLADKYDDSVGLVRYGIGFGMLAIIGATCAVVYIFYLAGKGVVELWRDYLRPWARNTEEHF